MVSNDEINRRLRNREERNNSGGLICSKCGTENQENAKSCIQCDNPIEALNISSNKLKEIEDGRLMKESSDLDEHINMDLDKKFICETNYFDEFGVSFVYSNEWNEVKNKNAFFSLKNRKNKTNLDIFIYPMKLSEFNKVKKNIYKLSKHSLYSMSAIEKGESLSDRNISVNGISSHEFIYKFKPSIWNSPKNKRLISFNKSGYTFLFEFGTLSKKFDIENKKLNMIINSFQLNTSKLNSIPEKRLKTNGFSYLTLSILVLEIIIFTFAILSLPNIISIILVIVLIPLILLTFLPLIGKEKYLKYIEYADFIEKLEGLKDVIPWILALVAALIFLILNYFYIILTLISAFIVILILYKFVIQKIISKKG